MGVNIKLVGELLKGEYEVTKVTVNTSYTLKLGKHGTITLQFCNNEFKKYVVDGIEKEKIENLLKTLDNVK